MRILTYCTFSCAQATIATMQRKFAPQALLPTDCFHYHQGVFLDGVYRNYLHSGDESWLQYIKDWVDYMVDEEGTVRYRFHNCLDCYQPGNLLFPLYIDRLPQVAETNADFAVIFGGTNDYFWSDMPIGNETSSPEYFYGAVDILCKQCVSFREPAKTLIVTPYPHNGIGNFAGGSDFMDRSRHDTSARNYNGHCLEDYVDALEEISAKYNIPVLNLHKEKGFDWKKHTLDGCHPNPEGHIWLAEHIKPLIKRNLQ